MCLSIAPMGKGYKLTAHINLPRPLDAVFPFFANALNLDRLTPPSLRFQVLTPPPIVMREGLKIDYRIRLHGIPIRWTSEITAWEPPWRFVDEQHKGPYKYWRHEHTFQEEEDGHTAVIDQVEYGVLGGKLAHRLFVQRDLRNIFTYRTSELKKLFG